MSDYWSSGSSSSSSGSYIPNYPQADILMQLAQLASSMGQQQYQWAQNQYAKTSQVTDQAVTNYLQASDLAHTLAQNNLDRYTQLFQPVENQLVEDANTYASEPRIRSEMGAAESGVGQSFDAARQNMERQLQSFGIDPSSGRYAELERANDAARAAAQAGAGQAARYNTEQTGRNLRAQAIAVGQQYPGQIANTLNAQAQDLAGAENAILANANTGANMFRTANDFLGTGMRLGYPPLGHNSSSFSQQGGGGSRGGGGGGGGSRGGGGGGGSGGYDPFSSYSGPASQQGQYGYQANPGYYSNQPSAGIGQLGDSSSYDNWGYDAQPFDSYGYDYSSDPYVANGGYSYGDTGWTQDSSNWAGDTQPFDSYGYNYTDPYNTTGFGDYGNTYDTSSYDSGWGSSSYDNSGYDPSSWGDTSAYNDYGNVGSYDYGGGYDSSSYDSGSSDWGNDWGSGGDWSYFAQGGAVPDPSLDGVISEPEGWMQMFQQLYGNADPRMLNRPTRAPMNMPVTMPQQRQQVPGRSVMTPGPGTPGMGAGPASSGGAPAGGAIPFAFAQGGAMPDATTGGFVSSALSPSGGAQTDDVPANLNANEFVIPRDVALWKGQEFFQKLIDQSRKARMGAPAKPSMGPASPAGA